MLPQQQPQPQAYAPQQPPPASAVHQEYAKRPTPARLPRPQQGRSTRMAAEAPQQRPYEDDHLEIPAFLRRAVELTRMSRTGR